MAQQIYVSRNSRCISYKIQKLYFSILWYCFLWVLNSLVSRTLHLLQWFIHQYFTRSILKLGVVALYEDWPCLLSQSLQVFPLWWINWPIHIWLLFVLLLCTIRYEWFHADIVLLWIHGLHLLWFFPHAWKCRFPSISVFCASHISVNQVWVVSHRYCGSLKFKSMLTIKIPTAILGPKRTNVVQ